MSRVIIYLDCYGGYINLEAEEFHEDGEYIKAYNSRQEIVAMVRTSEVKAVWRSEKVEK